MKGKKKKEPGRTFVLRVSLEDVPGVWRVIELTAKHTLHHLHTSLKRAFGVRRDNLYSFYLSGKPWDTDTEYGGPGTSTSRKANKAEIGKLGLEKGRAFLYINDFERERWFGVELMDEKLEVPKTTYPQVIEEEGTLPPREIPFRDSLPKSTQRWAQKIVPILETWALARTKSRGPKEVQQARELLKETYQELQKRGPDTWHLMEEATGMLLPDWLLSLPLDFEKRGYGEEAIKLCETFADFADKPYFLCEKALVFAQTGRRGRALEQVRENLTQYPDNPRTVTKSAEAFWKLEEIGPAERLFRKALDLAADDINERERVLAKLVAMLEENERTEEVTELIQSELDRG